MMDKKLLLAGLKALLIRKPSGTDTDQIKAIAYGRGDITVINSYYFGKLLKSKKEYEVEVIEDLGIFFPNQEEGERGTHINITGMGVVKYSKNKEDAIKFLEFMVRKKTQEIYPKAGYGYPVNLQAQPSKLLKSWGEFKEDKINLEALGYYNHKAVKVFNAVGWE